MYTIAAVSGRDNDNIKVTDQRFATVEDIQAWVPRELRGISSYVQVRVYDADGNWVGRMYRTGPGGTGETWAWEPAPAAPAAPAAPYEDLLREFAEHMGQLRQLHATVADHLVNLRQMQPWENRQMFENVEMNLRRLCGNPTTPVSPLGRPTGQPDPYRILREAVERGLITSGLPKATEKLLRQGLTDAREATRPATPHDGHPPTWPGYIDRH